MKSIQIAKLTLAIKNRFPTIADERLFSMIEGIGQRASLEGLGCLIRFLRKYRKRIKKM
jgi:hypothetical protein